MEKIEVIKDFIEKYNVSNYEISKNTGVSEAGLSHIKNGQTKNPRKITVDAIYNYLTTRYPNNEVTHNINSSNNIYINSVGDNSQDKTNEKNIYNEMIITQRELIDSLKEQITQYCKEIEYLRQIIKDCNENLSLIHI